VHYLLLFRTFRAFFKFFQEIKIINNDYNNLPSQLGRGGATSPTCTPVPADALGYLLIK